MAHATANGRAPQFWRVLDGYGSRVVREGCALGSHELPEKLGPGAVVEELALEGDRLHYWLQSGSGPTNGWVTVKARGQELLVRCKAIVDDPPLEVWIVTMGTRGDLQPFVVLGLALQEAGFRVRLFGPPELRNFSAVADATLNYSSVCGGWGGDPLLPPGATAEGGGAATEGAAEGAAEGDVEAAEAQAAGVPEGAATVEVAGAAEVAGAPEAAATPEAAAAPEEAAAEAAAAPEEAAAEAPAPPELRDLALGRPATASSAKSPERAAAFAVDGRHDTRWTSTYEDGQWLAVDLGEVHALSRIEVRWEAAYAESYLFEASLDGELWESMATETGREGWVTTALPSGSKGRWVRLHGQKRGLLGFGFSVWELRVLGPGGAEAEPSVSEAQPAATAADDEKTRLAQQQYEKFLNFLKFVGVDTNNQGDVEHMTWLWREMPKAVLGLQTELEVAKPDLLLYNHLMVNVGLYVWRSFGVRAVFVNLGLEFHFAPQAQDVFNYRTLAAFDNSVMRPMVGVPTVSAMRPKEFNELYTSSDRILGTTRLLKSVMPLKDKDKGLADSWNFTGFWILEEEKQMEDPAGFGGAELLQRLRDFVEAGAAPVYLGWGSMPVGPRVLAIAVVALRKLGLRAVVVRGWGYFSRELLGHGIWEMQLQAEEEELFAYADANVLFIDKAPHEWLFPRCACTVHHGGAGTTAAALRAGVPTVIVPLGYDQTYHGEWVESLGVGIKCSTVFEIQEPELTEALRRATCDASLAQRSRESAAALRQEPGVAGAVAQIRRVAREDVRSGKARIRWHEQEAARKQFEERVASKRFGK